MTRTGSQEIISVLHIGIKDKTGSKASLETLKAHSHRYIFPVMPLNHKGHTLSKNDLQYRTKYSDTWIYGKCFSLKTQ